MSSAIDATAPGKPTLYGQPPEWWPLYLETIKAGADLTAQLRFLVQAEHDGKPVEHVEAVRAVIWMPHRRGGES